MESVNNLGNIGHDVFSYSREYLVGLSESTRFFNLLETGQIILSIFLAILLLSRIKGIDWWLVPFWLFSFKSKGLGKIIDSQTRKAISDAVIFIDKNKIRTNKFGEFNFRDLSTKSNFVFKILAMGYFSKTVEYSKEALNMGNLVIDLEKIETENLYSSIWKKETFELIGGLVILFLLIWQVLFMYQMTPLKVWPFLIMALLNLIAWGMIILRIERKNVV
jgi:hypothetical protein